MDLNHGPSGYEPDELPDCSIPRYLAWLTLRFGAFVFFSSINITGSPRKRKLNLQIPQIPTAETVLRL
jgi:hypothetical protein